ncbi:hypothetical protein B0A48_03028 [Cryoendolithus antarcticus]|uniref:Peptidase S54 rhomboid domain-containing protein n=1 Tax=Cryoendolithus antarcticus TaxID=1507870 RepID=A0A1V8TLZ4_9PEZI|nr:hypothetical protein B0A48_03028 [Cryoendolithus antarcticus]
MNHALLAATCRAQGTVAQSTRKPLLQLFTSFRRFNSALSGKAIANVPRPTSKPEWRGLHTTSPLAARLKAKLPPKAVQTKSNILGDSKLQPAPTVVSYAEGVVGDEDSASPSWRDYDPEGGMPLPNGELAQPQVNGIFGSEDLDVDTGNYVLSVMQWRRMSGALIDVGLAFPSEREITRAQALRGLEYVRTLNPGFDEQAAGAQYAEEEAEKLRETLRARAVKLGLYKSEEVDVVEDEYVDPVEESDQGTEYGRAKYGESKLIKERKANEAAWEREQAEKEVRAVQAQTATIHATRRPLDLAGGVQPPSPPLMKYVGGGVIGAPITKAWLQPVERKPWVKYYEDQAQIIKDNVVPQLSLLRRLGPSLVLTLAVLAGCLYVSNNYTPPPKSARLFPDIAPAVATLGAITALTFAIFILARVPPLWRTSSKYFTVVPAYPYAASLLGATWRHDTFRHMASNVLSLWLFGLALHEEVGRGTFLAIFLGSGVVGGYASLVFNVLGKRWMTYIFGSSGAVLGVVGASCAIRPNGTISLLGYELPLAAWGFLVLFSAAEVFGLLRMRKSGIDHAGHLGGIAAGVAAAVGLRAQAAKRRAESGGHVMQSTVPAIEGA